MSEIKVNSIKGAAASTAAITVHNTDGTATGKFTNLPGSNLVVNGGMAVAQRGTTSTSDGYHTVDRFKTQYGGENEAPTFSQSPLTSSDAGPWEEGHRYSLEATNGNQTGGAGAGDYIEFTHRIEGQNIARSGWNYNSTSSKITLSFWVRSSVAQTFYSYLYTPHGTKQQYPFSLGSLSANTWTKVTKTIPGHANITINNDSTEAFRLAFCPFYGTTYTGSGATVDAWGAYGSGTETMPDNTSTWWTTDNATFAITGVQLEVGDTATDFEHKSYTEDLVRCQRYYHNYKGDASDGIGIPGTAWGTGSFTFFVQYPVTMRANPSIEGTGTCRFQSSADSAVFDVSDFTVQNVPTDFKTMTFNKSGGSGATVHAAGSIQMQSAGSILAFSAEI